MAPSFEIGNPQKSLVRIPGSGSDKVCKPVCLEIAQITSFAKSDAFPNILRPPVLLTNVGGMSRVQLSLARLNTASSRNQSTVANLHSSAGGVTAPKRTLDSETGNQAKKANLSSNSEDKTSRINNLLQDKEKLEEENDDLRKKIMMFKNMLKNKSKREEFFIANNLNQVVS